jgi:OPA family glycerol-3-phosphate transporter-like MFS transporter
MAGFCNIAFVLTGNFYIMLASWSLNGYFQSMIWGPLLRTISDYTPELNFENTSAFMSTSPVIGNFVSYALLGRLASALGWKPAFFLPGFLFIIIGCLWFIMMGFRKPVIYRTERGKRKESAAGGLFSFIVKQKIYMVIILGILVGLIVQGLTLWGPFLLMDFGSLGRENALFLMSLIPFINFIFIVLGGILIKNKTLDKYCFILILMITAVLFAFLLFVSPSAPAFVLILAFYGLMASSYTSNMIITTYIPFDYLRDRRVSSAAGIIDSSFYIGAAISGPALGAFAGIIGWSGVFIIISAACAASSAAVIVILRLKKNRASIMD